MYSVAVLLLLSGQLANSVLSPEFTAQLLTSDLSTQPTIVQRLCAVNMAAKLEMKEYSGSLLSDENLEMLSKVSELKGELANESRCVIK